MVGGERVQSPSGHPLCSPSPLLSPVSPMGQGISRWKDSCWDHPHLPIPAEVKDPLRALASHRPSQKETFVPP